MRRLNMYNKSASKVNKSHHARNTLLQSEPGSAQQSRTIQHSEINADSKHDSGSTKTFGFGKPKYRHLSPNLASSRNHADKSLTMEPNQDKLFGT